MSRRVLVGFILVNVLVSLAVALVVITYDRSRRDKTEPIPGPTQIVILTTTPLPGALQPVEYQATIDSLNLTGTALYANAQVVAVITATPDEASLGIPVPGVTPLATLDPAILPPVPTDLPPGQPSATPMDDGCLRHVVVAGEAPSIIAARYGVFVGDLLRANNLDENSIINIDQVLIVPVPGCNVLNTPTPIPPATNTPFQLSVGFPTVTLPPTAVNAEVTITAVLSPGEINSEAVELRNRGDVINMQGWVLRNTRGDIFRFPEVRFQPGAIMRIFTRQGLNTPAALYWGRDTAAWLVGDQVTLVNAAGEVQATLLVEAVR